jgi:hypothetical protein
LRLQWWLGRPVRVGAFVSIPIGNGSNGFFAGSDTSSNTFQDKHASGSGTFDCRDDSGGAGTANFWLNDKGQTSQPSGICQGS